MIPYSQSKTSYNRDLSENEYKLMCNEYMEKNAKLRKDFRCSKNLNIMLFIATVISMITGLILAII